MSGKREIEPSMEIVNAAIRQVLTPTLEQIAADAGRCISMEATVWRGETEIVKLLNIQVGMAENPVLPGNLRLRFRDAFGGRILMHVEALFEREQAVAKCSGFTLKADIRDGSAKRTAFTMRYSVWEWIGWI